LSILQFLKFALTANHIFISIQSNAKMVIMISAVITSTGAIIVLHTHHN